ncbi:MAG: DUF2249 domain-containing protein [Paracoccaceae bacterium]
MTGADLPGRHWTEAGELHIDVRGLRPPEPMVAILGQIDGAIQRDRITVHHDREPVYLYPELATRGWVHRIIEGEEVEKGEVRLILTRKP